MIIGKLDETLQQLQTISDGLGLGQTQHLSSQTAPQSAGPYRVKPDDIVSVCSSECLAVPAAFGSSDAIIQWPIFGSKWPKDVLSQEVLTCNSSSPVALQVNSPREQRRKQGVSEDNIPLLLEQFLQHTHSKNPILDTRQVREASKKVIEHGLDWSSASCIVVCDARTHQRS